MQITKFLPSSEKIVQETIATLLGLLISAWLIKQIPALQQMVNDAKPTTLPNSL